MIHIRSAFAETQLDISRLCRVAIDLDRHPPFGVLVHRSGWDGIACGITSTDNVYISVTGVGSVYIVSQVSVFSPDVIVLKLTSGSWCFMRRRSRPTS